jgi:molybdenum cofactor biosynthesis protein MoaC
MARKPKLSHLTPRGAAHMVSVSKKAPTHRRAVAEAWVTVDPQTAALLFCTGEIAKGNVLETARLAGIMAAKQTPALIPMCHPIPIEHVDVEARLLGNRVRLVATAEAEAKTGVEMEAMTAAAVAALTVYDMIKSAGKGAEIGPVRLMEKTGGKSGRWVREEPRDGSR